MLQNYQTERMPRLDVRYSQQIVLAAIVQLLAERDSNQLKQGEIAARAGCHLATVKRNVRNLQLIGRLKVTRDERGQTYSYEVLK